MKLLATCSIENHKGIYKIQKDKALKESSVLKLIFYILSLFSTTETSFLIKLSASREIHGIIMHKNTLLL